MKLLTVNVHSWLEENQLEKIDILAKTIVKKEYDIIALQEVNQLMDLKNDHPILKDDNYGLILLNKIKELSNLPYKYYWSNSHIGYDKYDEGISILSKLPILETDSFYCSESKKIDSILSRKIISVTVKYKNQIITCYSCHINLPTSKENQLENIKTILKRKDSSNLKILMGDFNLDAISDYKKYQDIKALGLYDTYELAKDKDSGISVGGLIDGWKNMKEEKGKRIDYIFITQEREVESSKIIFNGQNQEIISDHFGLEVILK